MLLLAMFPPSWRRVMDPRVLDFYRDDIQLAALKPRDANRWVASSEASFNAPTDSAGLGGWSLEPGT
jgi:hypothetical protein